LESIGDNKNSILYNSIHNHYIPHVIPPILLNFYLISNVSFMETTSSLPKSVLVLRWVARIFGTIVVLFILSLFIGEFLRKGYINVAHPGHYVLLAFWGLASVGILMAWRWEGIGGFLAAFGIIAFNLLNIFWVQSPRMVGSIVASLFWLIPAFIFIYCWRKTRGES
jgi:hypothetical protein